MAFWLLGDICCLLAREDMRLRWSWMGLVGRMAINMPPRWSWGQAGALAQRPKHPLLPTTAGGTPLPAGVLL